MSLNSVYENYCRIFPLVFSGSPTAVPFLFLRSKQGPFIGRKKDKKNNYLMDLTRNKSQ